MAENNEAGFGLNLNKPGDGSLGLAQSVKLRPVAKSQVNVPRGNIPAPAAPSGGGGNQELRDILGAALLGFQSNDPLQAIQTVGNIQNRRSQQAELQRQNAIKSIQLGVSLASSAASLPADQREAFITATSGTLTEAGDEAAANLFTQLANRPDHQVAIGGLEKTQIGQQLLRQDPSGKALTEFAATPNGSQMLDQIADQEITPNAFAKIQNITTGLDKLVRDGHIDKIIVDRVNADGKISIPEIQQLAESMPEGHAFKMTPAEISVATAQRNMDNLRSVGISLAEDFEPEEAKLQAQDNVVNANGEFIGLGVFDPKEGFKVQTDKGIRPLKAGERTVDTSGSLEDTGLVKKVTAKLQNELISTASASDRIAESISRFDGEFLTTVGKVKFGAMALAESTGIPLSDDMRDDLAKFTAFKAGALNDLNLYIKEITGAAMTNSEAERLRKAMPDPENDSPTQFLSKMQTVYDQTLVVRQRAMMALNQGIDATTISLSDVKSQILDGTLPQLRFNALMNDGLSAEQAKERIKREFPADMLRQAADTRRRK